MVAELLQFRAVDEDRKAIIAILSEALDSAEAGHIIDVAVVTVERSGDGPSFNTAYYGQSGYAALLAGVSALEFDLHWQRYKARDEN